MNYRLNLTVLCVWMAALCLGSTAAAQLPVSFQIPILGYVFDPVGHSIRPVVGIPGNARIGTPLNLTFGINQVVFLPGHRHALVSSPDNPEVLVLDLESMQSVPISGVSSSITRMGKGAGSAVALYYAAANKILVVTGLPASPVVVASIDLSFASDSVTRVAISGDGTAALLAFSSADQDSLYSWTNTAGPKFVTTASHISDLAFFGEDAVVTDSGADQVLFIRNVRGQASLVPVADSRDGVSEPLAISVFQENEIYIGNAGTGGILVLDAAGHALRNVSCACRITTMVPIGSDAIRLTDELSRPIFVLDRGTTDRILFVPALSAEQIPGTPQ